eukprot:UN01083
MSWDTYVALVKTFSTPTLTLGLSPMSTSTLASTVMTALLGQLLLSSSSRLMSSTNLRRMVQPRRSCAMSTRPHEGSRWRS